MTEQKKTNENRKHANERLLRSIISAYDILVECCHEIEDADLNPAENIREINRFLTWVHDASEEIYSVRPELRPSREPPLRRWPKDPNKPSASQRLTREDALRRLRHHLELVRLIIQESWPFADQLGLATAKLQERFAKLASIHDEVLREIWADLSDQQRRLWAKDWGKPEGVPELPPPDREAILKRLNEKLETAAKILDDCAEQVRELEMESGHIRTIGYCLGTLFEIQHQIYEERPDLAPQFLRDRGAE